LRQVNTHVINVQTNVFWEAQDPQLVKSSQYTIQREQECLVSVHSAPFCVTLAALWCGFVTGDAACCRRSASRPASCFAACHYVSGAAQSLSTTAPR
jgi:hypothetical protein